MIFLFLLASCLPSRPPGFPSDVGGLFAEPGADFLVADGPDRVFLGPLSQRCIPFLNRLADQTLHHLVPFPPAHEVPGGRHGGFSATGIRRDAFVRDKVKLTAMERDAVLLGLGGGHLAVSTGEERLTHESPHRTEAGAVGHSVGPTDER